VRRDDLMQCSMCNSKDDGEYRAEHEGGDVLQIRNAGKWWRYMAGIMLPICAHYLAFDSYNDVELKRRGV
jgi:hypothetical protein